MVELHLGFKRDAYTFVVNVMILYFSIKIKHTILVFRGFNKSQKVLSITM